MKVQRSFDTGRRIRGLALLLAAAFLCLHLALPLLHHHAPHATASADGCALCTLTHLTAQTLAPPDRLVAVTLVALAAPVFSLPATRTRRVVTRAAARAPPFA